MRKKAQCGKNGGAVSRPDPPQERCHAVKMLALAPIRSTLEREQAAKAVSCAPAHVATSPRFAPAGVLEAAQGLRRVKSGAGEDAPGDAPFC